VLGAVAIAFSSILVRLSHASPSTAAIFRCTYALPVLGFLAWLEDRRFGGRSWAERRTAVAAGVFFAADLILWHHSIGDIGAGLATVLANVQVVLVPLVAWMWLAEKPGRQVLAALTALLLTVQPVGSVALAAVIFSESPSGVQLAGVALVLLALLVATAPRRRRSPFYAIAGASGSRPSAASMSSAENSGSS